MNLDEYAQRLLQETIAAAAAEAEGGLRTEVFTALVAERLAVGGEFNDVNVAYHRERGVELSGWSADDDSHVLHLFATDYRGETPSPSLTNTAIAQAFKRLTEFFTRSLDGYAERLEESTPVFELADLIATEGRRFDAVRLYLSATPEPAGRTSRTP